MANNHGGQIQDGTVSRTHRFRSPDQKRMTLGSNFAAAVNNLGVLYTRIRRLSEMVASSQDRFRVAPAFDQSYSNLARIFSLEGENEKGHAVLIQLLKERPDHAQPQKALEQLKH